MDMVRETLEKLIRARGEDYASLSRLIGRNPAYIQQFIRRGVPRKLDEDDRRTLARYLGVEEAVLGAPVGAAAPSSARQQMVVVPRLSVGASAGPGALSDDETETGAIAFDPLWLRRLGARPGSLSMIAVQGESMVPTLNDGDEILVDQSDGAERIRDGIYVLRFDDALLVKRLALNPATRRLNIRSDNPAYPDWEDCNPADVHVIGRVVWVGRRLA